MFIKGIVNYNNIMFNWNDKSEKKNEKKISAIRAKALHLELNNSQKQKRNDDTAQPFKMEIWYKKV